MSDVVIIHHANCPDGFGSAWLLQQSWEDSPTIIAASYGDPVPDVVDGSQVFLVDYCYPATELINIAGRCDTLTILDHHQTALDYVRDAGIPTYHSIGEFNLHHEGEPAFAVLDMEHSGVGLVMQFTDKHVPFLYRIEDRDLWRFALADTPEVFAAVTSRPYEIEAWDEIEAVHPADLALEGRAIQRYRQKLIDECVANARMALLPTGHRVWVAAAPYAIGSDVAGELAKRTPTLFGAYYVEHPTTIRFGLRSTPDGADVAEIAEVLGGGGHKHASGFEVNRKWEGWT